MKFGVREICEVVLKAKAAMKVGNKVFYKNEPVIYFDTLKTSSMEGAATTVYAQGGRGNSRLVAWEGERTVTFNMEDALISAEGFMILSGAGLVDASEDKPLYQHHVEQTDDFDADGTIRLEHKPYLPADKKDNFAYVMLVKGGEIISEPYIPTHVEAEAGEDGKFVIKIEEHENHADPSAANYKTPYAATSLAEEIALADAGLEEKDVTWYETLFRTQDGVDLPAIFTIPNCKIQSNFTFTMASSGDPSTFNFVMDAFPDYTRFDHSKKVLATIQMFDTAGSLALVRNSTVHPEEDEKYFG